MADFGFTGEDVIREARRISPRVLLSFSTGKDSIGVALALRDAGFEDIQPFYLYQIPGNPDFIEESLDYYERKLFGGTHIVRLSHPYIAKVMIHKIHQPPNRVELIDFFDFQMYTGSELQADLAGELGWPEDALTAVGVPRWWIGDPDVASVIAHQRDGARPRGGFLFLDCTT
jgi:hypothetical protein